MKNKKSKKQEPDQKVTSSNANLKPKHSPIGASGRSRWSKCPGSVKMSAGMENVAGKAAQQGTAAHELISLAMETAFSKNISTKEVLRKTVEAVSVYSDYVESIKKDNPIHIEHSFDMSDTFDGLYGTADCVILDKATETLHVVDYKHGEALTVEVTNNLQLEYYALGALNTLGYACRWVQMTIVQPRAYHPDGPVRHWRVPSLHFIGVEADIIAEASETLKDDALLLAGPHCIFCAGKKKCPQKQTAQYEKARSEFGFYKDPKKDFGPV